jgi:hypothetical protein
MVRDQAHVDAAVDHFKRAGVDAVFMPHCNFGAEGAVGMIGAKLTRGRKTTTCGWKSTTGRAGNAP